ncbi:MAG: protein kinase, partial [Planctomycetes bacterium]|nr:protein kinase [Planctomycetota bacterium]
MGFGKAPDDKHDPLVGKVIGGCLLERRIGRGGMGSVYLASRQADHQSVAVKILAPFMAQDPAIVSRFTREVRAASRVRNPNVIRVLGSSEEEGIHFSLMEYIDGETLADLLKREGRLSVGH